MAATGHPRRARLCLLAALAAGGALAGTASAAPPSFRFLGGGDGHGVGMPQYGAYGAARAGWSAPRILEYFYRGTRLATIQPGAVRVLLAGRARRARVSSQGPWQAVDESSPTPRAVSLAPNVVYTVTRVGGGFLIRGPRGHTVLRLPGQARLQPVTTGGAVALGRRPYRGALRLVPAGRRMDVVNVVDLEQYLWSVVPSEMPSRWGLDAPAALRAQAVAARTYAVADLRPTRDFDLYNDQRSQVYGGMQAESPLTTAAVRATARQVLTYDGRPIVAYFFSSSGGRTEAVQDAFPASPAEPYLVSVRDPFDAIYSPFHRWETVPYTPARLGRLLGLRPVVRASVVRRGASGRAMEVRVVTRGGRAVLLTGAAVRRALGLRDTLFRVVRAA